MSDTNTCRLCLKPCTGFTSLYNDAGERNEIYDITAKYFDPTYLNVTLASEMAILCLECCRIISTFYNFQQSIIEAQKCLILNAALDDIRPHLCLDVVLTETNDVVKDEYITDDAQQAQMQECMATGSESFQEDLQLDIKHETDEQLDNADDKIMTDISTAEPSDENAMSDCDIKTESTELTTTAQVSHQNKVVRTDADDLIVQWMPQLECVICTKSFENLTLLKEHFLADHPDQKCRVDCCNRKFYRRDALADHARHHISPDTFICEVCATYHNSRKDLYVHMRTQHSNFRNQGEKNQISVECVMCKEIVQNFTFLKQHFRQNHPSEPCHAMCCNRKFDRGNLYEQHMQLHRNPEAYKCGICSKSMTRPDSLHAHMLRMHTNLKCAFP